jgi:YD repeat-containing protein
MGRTQSVSAPDGGLSTMAYSGLTTASTNALGQTSIAIKNTIGEIIGIGEADDPNDPTDGLIASKTLDAQGNTLALIRNAGPGNIVNSATYDTLGRKLTQTDLDAGYWTYRYNAAGEVIEQTDARGQVTRNFYDALGRVWKRESLMLMPGSGAGACAASDGLFCDGFEAGTPPTLNTQYVDTFTFDSASNGVGFLHVAQREERINGVLALTSRKTSSFDALARATALQTELWTPSPSSNALSFFSYSESLSYDARGRISAQTDASSSTLTTTYTSRGFPLALIDGSTEIYRVLAMTARGQVSQERRGLSIITARNYDAATGRPTTTCSGAACAIQDWKVEFDFLGNLRARERQWQSASNALREEFS